MTSNCFLADNNGAPWAVNGAGFDTDTVTAQASAPGRHDEREVGTFSGHQRGPPLATNGDSHMATDVGSRESHG